MFIVTAIKTYK